MSANLSNDQRTEGGKCSPKRCTHSGGEGGGDDISPLQCQQLQAGLLVHVSKITSQGPVS